MAAGEIKISTFTVGGMNVNDPAIVSLVGFNIYEDILNPLGPVGEARLNDFNDAIGTNKISGKEDVVLTFGPVNGQQITFKFKLHNNVNGQDGSLQAKGSMHSKMYDLQFVSPELLNAQGNFIEASYETQTSEMVKKLLKDFIKTEKNIDIQEQTKGNRRLVFHNQHFTKAYETLNHEHVSSSSKSSCYVTYVESSSSQKYVFTTFEKLFKKSTVVKLNQTTTLSTGGVTDNDRLNSIMWFKPSSTFFTPVRSLTKPNEKTYNLVTGKVHSVPPKEPEKYDVADSQTVFTMPPQDSKSVPSHTINDPSNNKQDTYIAAAKKNRSSFLAFLAQNSAELEVPGNTKIKLGSMIELNIPKKANSDNEKGEPQLNGKALVVAIRHKIKPFGQEPRYTMVLRVVKGSYKEGGGGNG